MEKGYICLTNRIMLEKLVEKRYGLKLIPEYSFHPVRKWRFDFAIPEKKIAIEVEGGLFKGGMHTSITYVGMVSCGLRSDSLLTEYKF